MKPSHGAQPLARLPEAERDGVEGEVLDAYDRSVAALADDLGADLVESRLPRRLSDLGALNGHIMSAEAYALLGDIVDDAGLLMDKAVRPRVRAGAAASACDYLRALAERERLKAEFAAALEGVDAVLTPTAATAAGLPTSLQVVCRGWDEATVLRIGWAFQAATDWHERAPPMAGEA